jgi:alkaline phosphatase
LFYPAFLAEKELLMKKMSLFLIFTMLMLSVSGCTNPESKISEIDSQDLELCLADENNGFNSGKKAGFWDRLKNRLHPPKNIIVLISDGCGYNQFEAASLYENGKPNSQSYQHFPVRLAMSTYEYDGSYNPDSIWKTFESAKLKATDSASAATTLSTGVKTYNGAIGMDAGKNPLKHITEYAEEKGKLTGVVTSVQFSHATPAGFVAHNVSRNNYKDIAIEMIYQSKTDLIMGCGHPYFNNDGKLLDKPGSFNYIGEETTWNELKAGLAGNDTDGDGVTDYWSLIETRKDFENLKTLKNFRRIIGVPQVSSTLQQSRGGDSKADPYQVPLNQDVPSLKMMTEGAIHLLSKGKNGFFLMVEGGAIDWAGHANQSGRVIEEQIDFNNTVQSVIDWVNRHSSWSETLVIVTADHETGYLTGPGSGTVNGMPVWNSLINNGRGAVPGMQWNSTDHTNSLVPVFAKGNHAYLLLKMADNVDPVRGKYIDNSDIGNFLKSFMK